MTFVFQLNSGFSYIQALILQRSAGVALRWLKGLIISYAALALSLGLPLIKNILCSSLKRAGLIAVPEPRYNDAKSKRPDIYVFASDRRILVDVSVIHPKADSFFREPKAPLGAANYVNLTSPRITVIS